MQQDGAIIMVAPNGARRGKGDHPALPLTPAEIAADARACLAAGACALHLHVRDQDGGHLLDADAYRAAIAAVRAAVGEDMVVQVTTEAVGRYKPGEQMALVRALKPEAVSLAVRELAPHGCDERVAADFFAWLRAAEVAPQFILYDAADVARLRELQGRAIVPFARPFMLFVLGRYSAGQTSAPEDLEPFLAACEGLDWPWMLCAFGPRERDCMAAAAARGGHARVGFENNLHLPDGRVAPDNAALVRACAVALGDLDIVPATAKTFRRLMAEWR